MRKLGIFGDTIKISDDFDAPLPDEILDAFEGRRRRKKRSNEIPGGYSVLIHSLISQPKLNDRALALIADVSSELFLSALSSWEITIKVGTGRLVLPIGRPTL